MKLTGLTKDFYVKKWNCSRTFAGNFKKEFESVEQLLPNVSMKFGSTTLVGG